MEKVCRDLISRDARLPPHMLSGWRMLLVFVEQQCPLVLVESPCRFA